jgi:hypothetical protein
MAKKVTKYEAYNGTLFDTEAEADAYNIERAERNNLSSYIDSIAAYGKVDADTLLTELTGNMGLGSLVLKYHRVVGQANRKAGK